MTPSPSMSPPPSTTTAVAQITSRGRALQEQIRPITIENLLKSGKNPVEAGAEGSPTLSLDAAPPIHGAYLHVPFCFHKCHYCDFYSIVDSQDRQPAFVDRLIRELEAAAAYITTPVETIFVGGGTPTLLAPPLWTRLLEAINHWLPRSGSTATDQGELTVEANPETVTPELADVLVAGGVNRVSVGCQSFNPRHLKTLERWHDPANVQRSVEILRAAGIDNINLDLIFAIPGQSLEDWQADLQAALSLRPQHLSCYSLMFEPNTPLTVKMKAGLIEPADQDLEAAMYETTIDTLAAAGFEHYEISNWARPGRQCRHNMLYWTNANWWPFGPSASGHVNGLRWKNVSRIGEYLDHGPLPPIVDVERLDDDGRVGEELMLRLRLIQGIELDRLHALLRGEADGRRWNAIKQQMQLGRLAEVDGSLRLTRSGLMMADAVIAELL